jgi:quercetin dioxygenase-like cupin family protein
MLIKTPSNVPAVAVDMEGAKDVTVRVLLGPADQAPTFAMRLFEIGSGGYSPYHNHTFEHEVMILSGDIAIVTPEGDRPVQVGDVALVAPNETHQFKNRSTTEPASFICLVPIAYQK